MNSNLTPSDKGQIGVYLLQNPNTQETYVGSGVLDQRAKTHERQLKTNSHFNFRLQRAYNRDPNFEFIGVPVGTKEEAFQFEQALLDELHGKPLVLNISADAYAPGRGVEQSPEHVAKRKEKQIGQVRSEETKQLMRDGWQRKREAGYKRSPESLEPSIRARRKPVMAEGVIYPSKTHAAQAHGLTIAGVNVRLKSPNFPEWKSHQGA